MQTAIISQDSVAAAEKLMMSEPDQSEANISARMAARYLLNVHAYNLTTFALLNIQSAAGKATLAQAKHYEQVARRPLGKHCVDWGGYI